jgi:hypothetical protein
MNTFFFHAEMYSEINEELLFTTFSIVVGVASLLLFDGFVKYTLWGLRESQLKTVLATCKLPK